MIYLIGAGLIMLLAVIIVALNYRGKAAAEQRHAELQKQRADTAEADVKQRHELDTALETLHKTQREETINAANPTHLAQRSDFNNDWSAATRMRAPGSITNSIDSGAAAADSTGAAADNVSRTEFSE